MIWRVLKLFRLVKVTKVDAYVVLDLLQMDPQPDLAAVLNRVSFFPMRCSPR